ncbi:MAG: type II toxin-antitoxin system VapC family toxin [Caldilineaceae bacterium]
MTKPISSFTGDTIYLDTMVFHAVLRASNTLARTLLKQIANGQYQAYTATLTFDELAYRMLLSLIRDKYGKSPQDRLRQDQAGMIGEFYPQIEEQLSQLQLLPNLNIVDMTANDIRVMHQNCIAYALLPRDALHLAIMQRVNCGALLSEDSDFDNIVGIDRYILA